MHIKHIHSMIEKLAEVAKCEIDNGVENIDTKEMEKVAEILKELSEAEYYAKISKAMDEAEYGLDYDYMGAYDVHERRGYKGQPRDSKGRYMRKKRMGYEEPIYMSDMYPAEYYRDMDRWDGKMYYTDTVADMADGKHHMRDDKEGKSGMMRKSYMETKEMHKDNTPENKQIKMKELEKYMRELSDDITEMISDATTEEKNVLKNKMQVLMQKIQ